MRTQKRFETVYFPFFILDKMDVNVGQVNVLFQGELNVREVCFWISNCFWQNGCHLSGFKMVGLSDFRFHSNLRTICNQISFRPFKIQAILDFRSLLHLNKRYLDAIKKPGPVPWTEYHISLLFKYPLYWFSKRHFYATFAFGISEAYI